MDKKSSKQFISSNSFSLLFLLIILIGAYLRLAFLWDNPPGIWCDEASTGYDAWSLINFGIDQHGKSWPFFFFSFADDLSGTYRYLVVLTQLVLGPTILSVRLPAALAGILTLVLTGGILKNQVKRLPALAGLTLLAFSPWHIPYCRTGQRIMLLPLGLAAFFYFFQLGKKKHSNLYSNLAILCLGLTLYTYVSARVVVPLLAGFLLLNYLKKKQFRLFITGVILLSASTLPLAIHALQDPGMFKMRFQQVSVLNKTPDASNAIKTISLNYLSHFSPEFLFFEGDRNLRHNQQNIGVLFYCQFPLLLMGAYQLIRKRIPDGGLLAVWILISPIPAALSISGSPHALRSVSILLPLTLLSAYGLDFYTTIRIPRSLKTAIPITWMILCAGECAHMTWDLLVKYPVYAAESWENGLQEAIIASTPLLKSNGNLWITSKAIGADRIVAWLLQIPPSEFMKHGINNTRIRWHWSIPIEKIAEQTSEQDIFIIKSGELPEFKNLTEPILYPDGSIAFRIVASTL